MRALKALFQLEKAFIKIAGAIAKRIFLTTCIASILQHLHWESVTE